MSKIVVSTTGAPAAIGPYSQAIVAGDTLYASGQIAPAAGDVAAQTEKAFDSVEAIVQEAGFAMTDIVKTTVYLADMGLCRGQRNLRPPHAPALSRPFLRAGGGAAQGRVGGS